MLYGIKSKKTILMKKFFLSILIISSFISCKSDDNSEGNSGSSTVKELENQVAQLKLDQQLKDSVINESLAFFNEIQSNLEAIGLKKDEIRLKSGNNELEGADKQWILEEIRHINYLRIENARKVQHLNDQLKKSGLKLKELETMIENLVNEIKVRDEQIDRLKSEMDKMDVEYSKLFDAYQTVSFKVDDLTEQLNTVYYSYGTTKELIKNKVIEQKNGFIGIGKTTKISENFNSNYFAKIDLTKDKELFIEGSDIRIITDHPSSSYTIVLEGKNSKIKIKNPYEFWKLTNYLVVIVD